MSSADTRKLSAAELAALTQGPHDPGTLGALVAEAAKSARALGFGLDEWVELATFAYVNSPDTGTHEE